MCCVNLLRTNFSSIFWEDGMERSDISFYELGYASCLMGFRMRAILASFHDIGSLCVIEK